MIQNKIEAAQATLHLPETGLYLAETGLSNQNLKGFYLSVGKRVFDVVMAMLIFVILLPLMALVALVTSLDGGSPFYTHERIGRNGRRFNCLKFRTMRQGSQEALTELLNTDREAAKEWHDTQKLTNDPRITLIGHLLRRTSLDELPQLLNVIRGDMSLVGPRPVTKEELQRYRAHLFMYLSLRPGLTGFWQVHGRGRVDYDERVEMDAQYFRTICFLGDLRLLFLTSFVPLQRRGK